LLRVLIADDEPLARRAIRRLLAERPQVEIVGESESVAETIDLIGRCRPDLVFLDIRLNGGNGFDLLAVTPDLPKVVFVTAYAEYAVDAFAVDAVDYLLKPIVPERLDAALMKVERILEIERGPLGDLIELRSSGRVVRAAPANIIMIRAEGDFSHILICDQVPLMVLGGLGRFEALLPTPPFFRLGRSIIINRDGVRSIETRSRDDVHVTLRGLASPIILGRAAAARLKAALAE